MILVACIRTSYMEKNGQFMLGINAIGNVRYIGAPHVQTYRIVQVHLHIVRNNDRICERALSRSRPKHAVQMTLCVKLLPFREGASLIKNIYL